jgi:hypothetical protein
MLLSIDRRNFLIRISKKSISSRRGTEDRNAQRHSSASSYEQKIQFLDQKLRLRNIRRELISKIILCSGCQASYKELRQKGFSIWQPLDSIPSNSQTSFPAGHAEAEAKALSEVFETNLSELATKADLREVEIKIKKTELALRQEISNLKFELLKWLIGLASAQADLLVGLKFLP